MSPTSQNPPHHPEVGQHLYALMELPSSAGLEHFYLHLLKLCLTGLSSPQPFTFKREGSASWKAVPLEDLELRVKGRDWPIDGLTMIGLKRLGNVQQCVEDVIANGVAGDLIETGVWRGGTTIFMRALLKMHRVTDRTVFVADSFRGLPPPDPERWPVDKGGVLHKNDFLRVPREDVEANFRRFGLLDEQVKFVEGWFQDTLPTLNDCTWSIIRLDGDLYGSTMTSLENLYPRLSPGGYVIIDDYGLQPRAARACPRDDGRQSRAARAVHDFREARGINEEMQRIDWAGVYWRKVAE